MDPSSSSSQPTWSLPIYDSTHFSHGKHHMFDKVVTPSDVGKLNRLVIPKQHAEKHFPLDSSSTDKGLLLDFEDRSGKSWRFRYSYWNSSQSYVMTKGWSRFVKDKKLDAGDVVSFQRASNDNHKFFIDWRRRPDHAPPPPPSHRQIHFNTRPHPAGVFYPPPPQYPPQLMLHQQYQQRGSHFLRPNFGSVVYMRAPVLESIPVVQAKRLRLFGVNMECTVNESSSSNVGGDSLELRLDGTSESTTTTSGPIRAIEFLDKGKSSMTLDFDI